MDNACCITARSLRCGYVLVAEGLCKIADFSLSRGGGSCGSDDDDTYTSSNGVFPVRWTAPEAMETMRFAPPTGSDWSASMQVFLKDLPAMAGYQK
jgi:hypothetical protein